MTDLMDGPPDLVRAVERAQAEGDKLRRMWVGNALDTLGINPEHRAGQVALDEYKPIPEDGPTEAADFSLLTFRGWLADRLGVDVI